MADESLHSSFLFLVFFRYIWMDVWEGKLKYWSFCFGSDNGDWKLLPGWPLVGGWAVAYVTRILVRVSDTHIRTFPKNTDTGIQLG